MSSSVGIWYDAFGGWDRVNAILGIPWKSFTTAMESGVNGNFCDKVNFPVIKDFDATRYVGRWYEQVHSYDFETRFDPGSRCSVAQYSELVTLSNGEKEFKVENS